MSLLCLTLRRKAVTSTRCQQTTAPTWYHVRSHSSTAAITERRITAYGGSLVSVAGTKPERTPLVTAKSVPKIIPTAKFAMRTSTDATVQTRDADFARVPADAAETTKMDKAVDWNLGEAQRTMDDIIIPKPGIDV